MENENQQNRDLENRLYWEDHNPEFTVAYPTESGIYGVLREIENIMTFNRIERRYE